MTQRESSLRWTRVLAKGSCSSFRLLLSLLPRHRVNRFGRWWQFCGQRKLIFPRFKLITWRTVCFNVLVFVGKRRGQWELALQQPRYQGPVFSIEKSLLPLRRDRNTRTRLWFQELLWTTNLIASVFLKVACGIASTPGTIDIHRSLHCGNPAPHVNSFSLGVVVL